MSDDRWPVYNEIASIPYGYTKYWTDNWLRLNYSGDGFHKNHRVTSKIHVVGGDSKYRTPITIIPLENTDE